MSTAISRKARLGLVLLGSLLALTLGLISGPASAEGATSPYCNPHTLGPWQTCAGVSRKIYQTYGWGDHASVCVWIQNWPSGKNCSAGAGHGVYSGVIPCCFYGGWPPLISNNSAKTNTVHGVALQP